MSYLSCPSCRFSVSTSAARSPFQNCPRCLLRESKAVMMVVETEPPRRFGHPRGEADHVADPTGSLSEPARGVGSA